MFRLSDSVNRECASLPSVGLDAHAVPEDPLAARAAVEVDRVARRTNVFVLHAALGRAATLAARLVALAVVIGVRLATGVGTSGGLLGFVGHTYLRICLFRGINFTRGGSRACSH